MTPSLPPQRAPAAGAVLIAGACLALLSGCTTVATDGGFGAVAASTRARIGAEPRVARDEASNRELADTVHALLAKPLDMDGAVRVALLNNPALQATYWEVGIAQADVAQAGRLQNPSFDFKHTGAGGNLEVERTLTFNLVGALLTPLARQLEARRFAGVKREVAARIERHALDTRRAWVEAVAAAQSLEYARQVDDAAAASAQLADRTARAGNMSQLDLARERVFYAETSAELARAGRRAALAREALTRLLGLWGADALYTLPAHLPDLPGTPAELQDVERVALESRLDVQAARLDVETTAANLGLTRVTRVVNALNLSAVNRTDTGAPTAHGYELNVAVPLFDWGDARVAKAQGQYMQAVGRVRDAAVTARSEARAGYLDYRTAYDVARHYRDTIIPLRKQISREVLLRYNGMQVGAADLLADSREQAAAVAGYIGALKEFWTAHAALEGALGMRVEQPAVEAKPAQPAQPAHHEEHAE